ncbi:MULTISPECIES: DUF2251 domain-containing protein [unclassified Avibacterium]|uniref:DUF2251 domain-containing protein n=1 Tax=unclassified Avibacterium TaxID=2685287 RepID=UPI0020261E83|nr:MULTISPECIES: DUF2251 domain-containing protein [unclassified Avibacterium]MCW9699843.1 DUF2251 domain-containing protein [Avibacterium sp. 20-129]MCW9717641.1 DUF2251 domain-containing protein [Avibacterium sp. 21-599]MCW9733199.1 DUF2251 domain-containing protein [Avibacterium sp. 20-15]URL05316.1 DUF2251 domain-containing protein [Avibacterium sp. 20-132]URL06459.1 DUF2251 domain-containing protein [Avibacterium sp. 21-595]
MLYSVLDEKLKIGEKYRCGAHSPQHEHLLVIFEDDGETGYFYALDLHQRSQPVVDSLFVYAVNDIDKNSLAEPRDLQICWSENGYQAFLLINGYPHAVFDFHQFVGYNHSKYPTPNFESMWVHKETTQELVNQWIIR